MFLAVWFSLLSAPPAAGDSIKLKNGRVIQADTVREENGKVIYTVGDNSFTIPKSVVEKIETGGSGGTLTETTSHADVDVNVKAPTPPTFNIDGDALQKQIAPGGKVDLNAINDVEKEGNADKAAFANFFAARISVDANNFEQAARFLDRARVFLPNEYWLMDHQASVLIKLARYREAADVAAEAVRVAPGNAVSYRLLGAADYHLDRTDEALKNLKHSLDLEPDSSTQQLYELVQREKKNEDSFSSESSGHFNLRYEGGQASPTLRRAILTLLEAQYRELVSELEYAPHEDISVILYTDQQFFDVTQAPSWADALNDGKLRIRLKGVDGITPLLSRNLKHELTHSFINQITHGRCPTWLNEGIAQMMEPRSAGGFGRALAQGFANGKAVPLAELEAGFTAFSDEAARAAYVISLNAVEYLRDTYGMSSIDLLLKRLGEGTATEAALRSVFHSGYAQLDQEIGEHLVNKYGN